MAQAVYLVDAFADGPFSGNPAGVCPLRDEAEDSWMQRVAMEMNQAETAFVRPLDAPDQFELRWFTPTVEVDLCGHATLATASILWERGFLAPDCVVHFHTRSGHLAAIRDGEWITLDFPAEAPSVCEAPTGFREAVGSEPIFFGRNRMDWFAEVPNLEAVTLLEPNLAAIAALGMRGLIVTSRHDGVRADFVSRCFFPQSGVPEDPVTGSAHCALGPYWARKLGKTSVTGYQASRRGGTVKVEVAGDRVKLTGKAATVLEGTLHA